MTIADEQIARARVFAGSLLDLTADAAEADAVEAELVELARLLAGDRNFAALADSPDIAPSDKSRSVARVFDGRVSELMLRFVRVLADHDALGLLRVLPEQYRRVRDERMGRVHVEVTTAAPLDAAQREQLVDRLGRLLGGPVLMREQVRPELIGGLVVRVGDTLFDGSVRQQLRQLRRRIVARGNHEIQSGRDFLADSPGNRAV